MTQQIVLILLQTSITFLLTLTKDQLLKRLDRIDSALNELDKRINGHVDMHNRLDSRLKNIEKKSKKG